MKTLFHKWRGLHIATAIAATTFAVHGDVTVSTLGGGPNQFSTSRSGGVNGNTLTTAKFNNPSAVAIDSSGNLFIADRGNNKVRKITQPGTGDSFTSTFASRLPGPVGVAVDASNSIYVVTFNDGKLRVFNSAGSLLRTVRGLLKPTALAVGADGTVYVTEQVGNLEQISTNGTVTLVLSGLKKPQGIALLPGGLLAVSDTGNNAISIVNPANGTNTVIAGGSDVGFNGAGFANGPGAGARFNQPWNIAAAPNGALVIADRKNHRVRVIDVRTTNYVVSTLFGIDPSQWANSFVGWSDGPASTASVREPLGVAVNSSGTVFDTEVTWHLVRQATGGPLTGTNGTGNTTNVVVIGTNVITVVGTNVISFGFESGEASSDFVGAAGQKFYAPVTLAIAPGQKAYSFQMSLSATGETGIALDPLQSGFVSMVMQPVQVGTISYYTPIKPNYEFLNSSINLLGVGWIERITKTNLYDTTKQDVITYSIAKNTLFLSSEGKVILGAYRLPIPVAATNGSSFRIALHNPSGTADGISQPVPLTVPTNGSLGAGAHQACDARITCVYCGRLHTVPLV
jgi:sugar lactone lactonase YvrE